MPKLKTTTLAAALLAFAATPALAVVTVTNETDQQHTITFDHGAEETKHDLAPNASVEEACPDGCDVRFSGHDKTAADGDTLLIKPGMTMPVRADG